MSKRRRSQIRSGKSSATSNAGSLAYFHKPNLGDKLQRLADLSPQHLRALELLADQILRGLSKRR